MKTTHAILVAILSTVTALVSPIAKAQDVPLAGLKRTSLLKNDLSVPGREVSQVLVEFGSGTVAARHSHPGEELVYIVAGVLEYALDGKAPVTLKAGDTLFIPYGTIHSVKNVGPGNAAELATYIVEKGKPLVTLAQ